MTPETLEKVYALLKEGQVVFWDFDGVIKDSVKVKSVGYEQLFLSYGQKVVKKVRQHHKDNGGISRYEKIPLYLSWAGEPATADQIKIYCDRFSGLVKQAVINSPWVQGVREYLLDNHTNQYFILMTATPQEEIEQILHALGITGYFREIYGAPSAKVNVVGEVLNRLHYSPEQALVVGDSDTDLHAAEENKVVFLLRCTTFNKGLQERFQGASFKNL